MGSSLAGNGRREDVYHRGLLSSAGPVLASIVRGHPALMAYFERLIARPSVARVIEEARPYFAMFHYREAMPSRFLEGA